MQYKLRNSCYIDDICHFIQLFPEAVLFPMYEGVSKSFRTGRLERELQMVRLSATKCSCIAIL